jgi:nucleoid DNA-binding protein
MYPIIRKYLLQYKKVSVPGIGNFSIEIQSSFFTEEQTILQAPQNIIVYKPETALADRIFYDYLAKELRINEVEAIKHFHEFTYQLKQDISNADSTVLPGIGTLIKQPNGSFSFEQEAVLNDYFSAIKVEQPLQKNTDDLSDAIIIREQNFNHIELTPVTDVDNEKKDYWWVFAIVLAIVGIAAIIYKL